MNYSGLKEDKRLIEAVPTARQIAYESMEFFCFIHFTVNTFTGREWGDGTEPESIFNPTELDAKQWAKTAAEGGMKGLILTCKHHDGFCLWPSKYTEHSIKNSPYKNGKGDIVRETMEACREYGLKFGVYLSPWDRNNEFYGKGKEYDDYYVNQLTELLTEYGDIFVVWLDGACGEGANGKVQKYDWQRYYQVVRKLQPNAEISISGPDIRWCGNEAGEVRPSEWSVVAADMKDPALTAELSQQEDNEEFRERPLDETQSDLGSRERLAKEERLAWYPAETDVSIRPGWFYHEEEDDKVRSFENLKQLGDFIKESFSNNLVEEAGITTIPPLDCREMSPEVLRTDDYETYFLNEAGTNKLVIKIKWIERKKLHYLVLKEAIPLSQRVEAFNVCYEENGCIKKCYEGTTIGYKRIVDLKGIHTDSLAIVIEDSRVAPAMAFVGVY